MKFFRDNRVAIYTPKGRMTGTVLNPKIDAKGLVRVELDDKYYYPEYDWEENFRDFHPKQLRKLKKNCKKT